MANRLITLLTAATSSTGPAVTNAALGAAIGTPNGAFLCDQAVVLVKSTAGSGAMTASLRLWGFQSDDGRWYDLGPLNAGTPIAETTIADTISYAEGVAGLRAFTRLYCEIVGALGGAATAITVQACCTRADPVTSS